MHFGNAQLCAQNIHRSLDSLFLFISAHSLTFILACLTYSLVCCPNDILRSPRLLCKADSLTDVLGATFCDYTHMRQLEAEADEADILNHVSWLSSGALKTHERSMVCYMFCVKCKVFLLVVLSKVDFI